MSRRGENITKRKDGRWEARVIYARDESGKARYRYLYGKTYKEAKSKKAALQSQIILCIPQLSANQLTVNHLISQFLLHKKSNIKESTFHHYQRLLQCYVVNELGHERIQELTSVRIERYAQKMLEQGSKSGQCLSSKTVRDILSLLRSMFRYGIKQKYISQEILNFSLPRPISKTVSVLESNEQKHLEKFAFTMNNNYKFGIYLCLYTGLRLGEICALRWSDIDTENAILYVKHTIQRIYMKDVKKSKIIISEPKTHTSIRAIPIPQFLKKFLLHIQKADDIYFLTGTNKYIEPSNYYMKYKRWLKKLKLPQYSFHTLRHTFATRCVENGFDAKTLSEILGHTDVKITLNLYVHPTLEMKRSQMERLLPMYLQSDNQSENIEK